MFNTIGSPPQAGLSDPIGMMSDCHRRIERFLGALVRLSETQTESTLNALERDGLTAALRYFRESAPKHTADEDESLFPRVGRAAASEGRLMDAIQGLSEEHTEADALHKTVDALGRRWLDAGALSATDRAEFAGAVDRLAVLYRDHIDLEETVVFPAARDILSADLKREVAAEMAARRNLAAPETNLEIG